MTTGAADRGIIRVVLVDDQTLLRTGLRGLLDLTSDIRVVGEANDGDEAVPLICELAPDLLLLDVRMPGRTGPEVVRALRAMNRLPPTILLTTFDDDGAFLEGIKAGARGFLLKDISFERLTEAIRTVAAGGSLILPAVTERVLRGLERLGLEGADPDAASEQPPTRREREILRLLAGGYSNREIGDVLGTSEGTIKNQISSILAKLGVRDRTRAVLKAIERGYL
jgi:DNA-binding NarL/FixJ family response regulator